MKSEKFTMKEIQMSNEQITDSREQLTMRNEKLGMRNGFVLLPLFFILCFLFFGCDNLLVQKPEQKRVPAGYGNVRVGFVGGEARTVFPSTDIFVYEYTFTANGEPRDDVEPNEDGSFSLEAGPASNPISWTVSVNAYVGSIAPANLAATGVSEVFTLLSGEVKDVVIILTNNGKTDGEGSFKFSITYPAGVTAEVTLQLLPDLTADVDLGTPPVGTDTPAVFAATVAEVPAGFYLLTVQLRKGGLHTGRHEVIHIYDLLTTEYNITFAGGDLLKTVVDIAAVPGVTPPAKGGTPEREITATAQYTGSVEWTPAVADGGVFAPETLYSAVITLTALEGYTFEGVAENFFTVAGAARVIPDGEDDERDVVANNRDSGVVYVTFPATAPEVYDISFVYNNAAWGSASADPNPAEAGQEVMLTTAPANEYGFDYWEVVSGNVTVASIVDNKFAMPAGPVTLRAVFYELADDVPYLTVSHPHFDAEYFNYTQPGAVTVTVTNTGRVQAAVSGITLGGANAASFDLSGTGGITSIAGFGGTASFTVRPKAGLGAGTHNATINVAYNGAHSPATNNVSFTVNAIAVTGAAITVTEPVTGIPPDTTASGTGNFTTGAVTWSPAHNPFVRITQYTATLTLTAAEGHTFTGLATGVSSLVTVNGHNSTVSANTGAAITLSYQFEATECIHVMPAWTPPTCTTPGNTRRDCSLSPWCGHYETRTDGYAPLGHEWIDANWITTKVATCIANGDRERECNRTGCSEKQIEIGSAAIPIDLNNHVAACDRTIYTIMQTGTATQFSATKGLCNMLVGTADQTIQNAVNAIRGDATGTAVTVQFGNGTDVLDIGTASASFNNTGGTWTNPVMLRGRITTNLFSSSLGTLVLADDVSINISTADIANTSTSENGVAINNTGIGAVTISGGTVSGRQAIRNASTGTVTISGGTVSGSGSVFGINGGQAVHNASTGTVNISDGTVSGAQAIRNTSTGTVTISGGTVSGISGGQAVHNASTGTVNISGGTVSSVTGAGGQAVHNASTGVITISGTALLTSVNTQDTQGTVNNNGGGTININGGTIRNTFSSVSNSSSRAVRNSATGTININGGTISAERDAAFAVLSENTDPRLILNNRPAIIGRIRAPAGGLIVDSGFNPGATDYLLNFASYSENDVLVAGGAAFVNNFFLSVNDFIPVASGSDIVAAAESATYYFVHQAEGSVHTITRRRGSGPTEIQPIIDDIRTAAAGNPLTIQFGGGGNALDIGTQSVSFNNTGGTWGTPVTLTGSIISGNTSSTQGTIVLADTVSIHSTADITNGDGRAIHNGGTGTVTISGGTVSAAWGVAVLNSSTGAVIISGTDTVITSGSRTTTSGTIVIASSGTATAARLTINGGTVRNTADISNARAVNNLSTGAVIISGGTVGAMTAAGAGTTGVAVWNNSTGALTISGADTVITSADTTATQGTVNNNAGGSVTIEGGTVRNIAANANANAIRNGAAGTVNISGGTVGAMTASGVGTSGTAVRNNGTGSITISGTDTVITSANVTAAAGTVFIASSGTATATRLTINGGTIRNTADNANARAVYNASTGAVAINGGTVQATGAGFALWNAGTGAFTVQRPPAVITGNVSPANLLP